MKGLIYNHYREYCGCCGRTYFCMDEKVHVAEHYEQDGRNHSVEVLGPCDGSCAPRIVDLDRDVADAVHGYLGDDNHEPDEVDEESFVPVFVEKTITKLNRWARRNRWSRGHRPVMDFS